MQNKSELNLLIEKIKLNNLDALKDLYEMSKTDIFAFVLSIVKNYYDAEDIMHNVYVSIAKNAYLYVHEKNPASWIFTIAKNESLMYIRNKNKEIHMTHQDIDDLSQTHVLFNYDDKILIDYLLNNLNDLEREILILHDMNGFKHREIAKILEIPLSTVLSKYNRSIKKIRTFLKEEDRKC